MVGRPSGRSGARPCIGAAPLVLPLLASAKACCYSGAHDGGSERGGGGQHRRGGGEGGATARAAGRPSTTTPQPPLPPPPLSTARPGPAPRALTTTAATPVDVAQVAGIAAEIGGVAGVMCAITLVGLAIGFVLLRVESAVEGGE